MKSPLIRKTWPKIRIVTIKGEKFYRVDARKTGTNGKQETFKSQKVAESRATEIEEQFSGNGTEEPAFPAELRGMALTGEKILRPHGRRHFCKLPSSTKHIWTQEKYVSIALGCLSWPSSEVCENSSNNISRRCAETRTWPRRSTFINSLVIASSCIPPSCPL